MFKENLEARYYTDPAIYRQEQSGIFNSNWQLIAPRSRFVEKGDYVATDIAGTKVSQCCLNQDRAAAGRFAVLQVDSLSLP